MVNNENKKEDLKPDKDEYWQTYESNVQSYRGLFFSTQSIFVAVGAFLLEKSLWVLIAFATLALLQIWAIWFTLISARHKVIDYHKYSLYKKFNKNGNLFENDKDTREPLQQNDYVHNKTIRKKIGLKTWRETRVKIDIITSLVLTLIWSVFLAYGIITFISV